MGFIIVNEVTRTSETIRQLLPIGSITRIKTHQRFDFPDCNVVITLLDGSEIYVTQELSSFVNRLENVV